MAFPSFVGTEVFYQGKLLGKVIFYNGNDLYLLELENGSKVVVPWIFLVECSGNKPEEPKRPIFKSEELDF